MSIFFPYQPESPVTEKLVSLTDVLTLKSGLEQRVGLRIAPRQELTYNYLLDEVTERPFFENILFTAQNATFSVPIWSDVAYVTSPITATNTVLNISTLYSDFRNGNKLAIFSSDGSLTEILTISTFTETQITVTSGAVNSWPVGTRVFPLQDCLIGSVVKSSRSPVGLVSYAIQFNVIDSSINLATAITYPTYGTLGIGADALVPVVDDYNMIENVIQESNDMSIMLIDGNTGTFSNLTYLAMARRGSVKSWTTTGRVALWYVRKFLHQINGRLTSFFLPTFAHDVTAVANITSGSSTLNVVNTGLTAYGGLGQGPRKYIRIEVPATGLQYVAQVASTSVISSTVEQITINGTWPDNVAYTSIARICILERVRFASDTVTIEHHDLAGTAKITVPVIAVLDGSDSVSGGGGTGPISGPLPPAPPGGGGGGGGGTGCSTCGCNYSLTSKATIILGPGYGPNNAAPSIIAGIPYSSCGGWSGVPASTTNINGVASATVSVNCSGSTIIGFNSAIFPANDHFNLDNTGGPDWYHNGVVTCNGITAPAYGGASGTYIIEITG